MKRTIMATADGHIERLEMDHFDDYLQYIKDSIRNNKPDIFIYAGDASDSRNVRAESIEYKNITRYMRTLSDSCIENDVECIYIKGTPSHDGDVIKRIIEINELSIKYVEDPEVLWSRGLSILLLPEIYTPSLSSFYDIVEDTIGKGKKVDVVAFHGMFDFAIPQLKQIDSAFNQSRSVVINTREFMNRFVNIMAFGGHVHRAINSENCFYLGRFINERHQSPTSDMLFGFKLIAINDEGFKITNIPNPYLLKYNFLELKITKETKLDDILSEIETYNYDVNKTVYKVFVDKNRESRHLYKLWKKVFKPVFVKRKFVIEKIEDHERDIVSKVDTFSVDKEDLSIMISDMYKEITNKNLDNHTIKILFGEEE